MTQPMVAYCLFYGAWSSTDVKVAQVTTFLNGIGATAWYKTNLRYVNAQGTPPTSTISAASPVFLGPGSAIYTSFGRSWTVDRTANVVSSAISSGLVPLSDTAIYFVLTSTDVVVPGLATATGGTFCGYHDSVAVSGKNVIYSLVGDMSLVTGCQDSPPNTLAMASIIAHELVEAISDPLVGSTTSGSSNMAYQDPGGTGENGDMCSYAGNNVAFPGFPNGYLTSGGLHWNLNISGSLFLVQPNWDPWTGKCVMGIFDSPPPPAVAASPSPPPPPPPTARPPPPPPVTTTSPPPPTQAASPPSSPPSVPPSVPSPALSPPPPFALSSPPPASPPPSSLPPALASGQCASMTSAWGIGSFPPNSGIAAGPLAAATVFRYIASASCPAACGTSCAYGCLFCSDADATAYASAPTSQFVALNKADTLTPSAAFVSGAFVSVQGMKGFGYLPTGSTLHSVIFRVSSASSTLGAWTAVSLTAPSPSPTASTPPPAPPKASPPPALLPSGCAAASLLTSATLSGSYAGTFFSNPSSTTMDSLCGAQLCTTNYACTYGCFCFSNAGVLTVVGFYFSAVCGSFANGSTVTLSGIVTDSYGEITTPSGTTCTATQSSPPPTMTTASPPPLLSPSPLAPRASPPPPVSSPPPPLVSSPPPPPVSRPPPPVSSPPPPPVLSPPPPPVSSSPPPPRSSPPPPLSSPPPPFLSASPPAPRASPPPAPHSPPAAVSPPPPPSSATWDYILFDLQWPYTLCADKVFPCTGITPPSFFTVHGYWPSKLDGSYPSSCGGTAYSQSLLSASTQTLLNLYWPTLGGGYTTNTAFWKHEYTVHGTCARDAWPTVDGYFAQAMASLVRYNITAALANANPPIFPSATASFSIAAFNSALVAAFGQTAVLQCDASKRVNGAIVCLTKAGNMFACPSSVGSSSKTCSSTATFLPAAKVSAADPVTGLSPPPPVALWNKVDAGEVIALDIPHPAFAARQTFYRSAFSSAVAAALGVQDYTVHVTDFMPSAAGTSLVYFDLIQLGTDYDIVAAAAAIVALFDTTAAACAATTPVGCPALPSLLASFAATGLPANAAFYNAMAAGSTFDATLPAVDSTRVGTWQFVDVSEVITLDISVAAYAPHQAHYKAAFTAAVAELLALPYESVYVTDFRAEGTAGTNVYFDVAIGQGDSSSTAIPALFASVQELFTDCRGNGIKTACPAGPTSMLVQKLKQSGLPITNAFYNGL